MKTAISIIVPFLVCLLSCSQKEMTSEPTIIHLQSFDGISETTVNYVYRELEMIHPGIILNKQIPLSQKSYFKPRNRYRADSLIKFLLKDTPKGHKTIAITDKDISTTKGKVPDFGIMGLGYQPGRSCVVSTFRLSKKNLREQLFKVCIHELGHTEGLPHCPTKNCYMRDAEGKNYLDEEDRFCDKCKVVLRERGWVIN